MSNLSTQDTDYLTGKKRSLPDYTPSDFTQQILDSIPRRRKIEKNKIVKMVILKKKIQKFKKRRVMATKKKSKPKYKVSMPNFDRYALDYLWYGRVDENTDGSTIYLGSRVQRFVFNTNSYGFMGNNQTVVNGGSGWNYILNADGTAPSTGTLQQYSMTTAYSQVPTLDIAVRDQYRRTRSMGCAYDMSFTNNKPGHCIDIIVLKSTGTNVPTADDMQNPINWSRQGSQKYTKEYHLTEKDGSKNYKRIRGYMNNYAIQGMTREQYQGNPNVVITLPIDAVTNSVSANNGSFLYVYVRTTAENGALALGDYKFTFNMRMYYEFFEHRPLSF